MTEDQERKLLAAQGYSELDMHDDALDEIGSLPADAQREPPALEIRLIVLMHAHRWGEAIAAGRALSEAAPDRNAGYIHTAFCLHETGLTTEARELLLAGPESLHNEPTYHYNLACYECRLGNPDLARLHLEKCFALDKKFRDFAKTDPDLAALK
jgi:predicted Zn-dependent protease